MERIGAVAALCGSVALQARPLNGERDQLTQCLAPVTRQLFSLGDISRHCSALNAQRRHDLHPENDGAGSGDNEKLS